MPRAGLLVPASGIPSLLGGRSGLAGHRARAGAALRVLFPVPVPFALHAFWAVPDPRMARLQAAMFFKNLALIGGAMLMTHFGAGPYRIDARRAGSAS